VGGYLKKLDGIKLTLALVLATQILFGGSASHAESVTTYSPAAIIYSDEVRGKGLFLSGDSACQAARPEPYNPGGGFIVYSGGTYAFHPDFGSGCYYSVYFQWDNSTQYIYYQGWARPLYACEEGDSLNDDGQCVWSSARLSDAGACHGNPIRSFSGAKVEAETDFTWVSAGLAIPVRRSYSSWSHSQRAGLFGPGWHLDQFGGRLVIETNYGNVIGVRALTGPLEEVKFSPSSGVWSSSYPTPLELSQTSTGWKIVDRKSQDIKQYNSEGKLIRWLVGGVRVLTLTYGNSASPDDIASKLGLLSEVTDEFGGRLGFRYDSGGRIVGISGPGPITVAYAYDYANGGQLASVTFQDKTSRRYAYRTGSLALGVEGGRIGSTRSIYGPPPSAFGRTVSSLRWFGLRGYQPMPLSAIYDELGTVLSQFDYDASGRAISTELTGGVQRWRFTYAAMSEPVVVTDPLGSVYRYQYESQGGLGQLSSASQPGGSGCGPATASATYTASGLVASQTDFNGRLTCFAYDETRPLELFRMEGAAAGASCPSSFVGWSATPASSERMISTRWHPDWHLTALVAEPLKITTFVYNGQAYNGRNETCAPNTAQVDDKPLPVLCRKVERSTRDASGALGFAAPTEGPAREWRFTYDRIGRLLSVDGPRTDVVDSMRLTYHPDNDPIVSKRGALASVTNAAGHVTRYTAYDTAGRVTTITEPSGVSTTLSRDLRGRVTSARATSEADARTTLIGYRPNGQVSRVTQPDGSVLNFTYDAARRLKSVTDGAGNSVSYVLDTAGNRTDEQYKDASGTLRQRVSQVFDGLNRLRSVTGAQQ